MNWMARAALIAMIAGGLTPGVAHADPAGDHCSTRSGCYTGPGSRWCPGDYVWPGLVATGWDLTTCHVYHEQCPPGYVGGCPDDIVDGPAPPGAAGHHQHSRAMRGDPRNLLSQGMIRPALPLRGVEDGTADVVLDARRRCCRGGLAEFACHQV
jgi:hypothetical protein